MKHLYLHIISAVLLFFWISYPSHAQTITVWETAANQDKLLARQADVNFTAGNGTNQNKITIDEFTRYQSVEGFGWTMTQGAAKLIRALSETQQAQLLNDLFHPDNGIGSAVIRIGIGATDLSESSYTYNESNNDWNLANFSLAGPDLNDLIPVLKKALAINPDIKILATPWTAPTWMKKNADGNNKFIGGELNSTHYAVYARYFIKYFEAMRAQGLEVWAVTPQNEPLHAGNEPSMYMSKEQQYDFVHNHLGPAIENSDFSHVKIIAYDHNCDHPEYPEYVCQSKYVDGSAFHLYDAEADIEALTRVYNSTGKSVYFTEQYTGPGSFSGDFAWHMRNVMLGAVNNFARIVLEWNLAADASHGPHTPGGCVNCLGALTVDGTAVTKNVSYYLVAQMSKATQPGAYRLASSSTNDNLLHTAFYNPDGSVAMVVFNDSNQPQTFDIVWNGNSVSYRLTAKTTASLVWQSGDVPVPVTGVTVLPAVVNDLPTTHTIQLEATILPADASIKTVIWASDDPAIASVSSSGLVRGIRPGAATITVTTASGNKQATCKVNVIQSDEKGDFPHVYNVISVYSDKGVDVIDQSMEPGTGIQQWAVTNGGGDNQRWLFEYAGDDSYYIKSKYSKLYLTVAENANGADILQQEFTGADSQLWIVTPVATDAYKIISRYSNKAMDVEGPSETNGAKVHTWEYGGGDNQKWKIVQVETVTTGQDITGSRNLAVFPNPVFDQINIVFDSGSGFNVALFSLSGELIYASSFEGKEAVINSASLDNGAYILRITDGNEIYYHKIIKKTK